MKELMKMRIKSRMKMWMKGAQMASQGAVLGLLIFALTVGCASVREKSAGGELEHHAHSGHDDSSLSGHTHYHDGTGELVEKHLKWGQATEVYQYYHNFFSGVPDRETLRHFKKRGGVAVLDLRTTGGSGAALAAGEGLKYHSVPVQGFFTPSQVDEVERINEKTRYEPLLTYAEKGDLAAAWLAIHLVRSHRMAPERAFDTAVRAGLRDPDILVRTRQFLELPADTEGEPLLFEGDDSGSSDQTTFDETE